MTDKLNKNGSFENIELSLPVNAAYVSAARFTAQSIAGRIGFDAVEVEDIKTAVSEACTYIIKKLIVADTAFKITFMLELDYIEIHLSCGATGEKNDETDYSMPMVRALMDNVRTELKEGLFELVMTKKHKTTDFV